MNITDLNGKSIAILGAHGREGRAMQGALEKYAPDATVALRDMQDGDNYLDNLDQYDIIIKAPGIPPCTELDAVSAKLTNATQIFLDSIHPDATVIGITGSKGKSTTSSLIAAILKEAGTDVSLLGNIGDPAIAHIEEIKASTTVVIELSSYQLMQVSKSPQIAVITSFFPEHLDYHGSIEHYKEAKKNLCKNQTEDGTVFYYAESDGAKDIAQTSKGTHIAYSESDSPISVIDTKLIGMHNLFNIAGAAAVTRHLGVDDDTIIAAVRTFEGLPHRLKDLGRHHGIRWVDDAISTTPESTIAAIHALVPNVKTVILGGQDRGNDFEQLGKVIDSSDIASVIVMGESGPRIEESIDATKVHSVSTMEEAVQVAKQHTPEGAICLLSPASPSYGMFKDFEEKGDAFEKCIVT